LEESVPIGLRPFHHQNRCPMAPPLAKIGASNGTRSVCSSSSVAAGVLAVQPEGCPLSSQRVEMPNSPMTIGRRCGAMYAMAAAVCIRTTPERES
jgi:hypothetical protein